MVFSTRRDFAVTCLLCYVFLRNFIAAAETKGEARPYEFSFNIVDFQHRYEKKDKNGIVTGEFGFITADGVYHETSYATDKNDDFIITRMRNRKINSLKDALEIFKDRPEAAKKLVEAVAKACSGCQIPVDQGKPDQTTQTAPATIGRPKYGPVFEEMLKVLKKSTKLDEAARKGELPYERNRISENSKDLSNERRGKSLKEGIVRNMVDSAKKVLRNDDGNLRDKVEDEQALEKMANELYYRFNYTITSHEHQEDGYRSGKKDGSYRAQSENGVDTRVRYLSNEFGHQPNISFVPRTGNTDDAHRLKGYSFLWYWT